MELSDFFDLLDAKSICVDSGTIGERVLFNCYDKNKLSKADVVFIGISEKGSNNCLSNKIREQFYLLYYHFNFLNFADLGNLRIGHTPADRDIALSTVLNLIPNKKASIIFLSDFNNISVGIIKSIASPSVPIVSYINSRLFDKDIYSSLRNDDNVLFLVHNIASQKYYNSQVSYDFYSDLQGITLRLSDLRSEIEVVEPYLRDSNYVNFNLSAVRSADAPAQSLELPNGLYADEICRLARYAGISDKTKYFTVAANLQGNNVHSYSLLAQIVWYISDGISSRYNEYPQTSLAACNKYIVTLDDYDIDVVFYESKISYRWWVEILSENNNKIFATSHSLYLQVCKGEIPLELVKILT